MIVFITTLVSIVDILIGSGQIIIGKNDSFRRMCERIDRSIGYGQFCDIKDAGSICIDQHLGFVLIVVSTLNRYVFVKLIDRVLLKRRY